MVQMDIWSSVATAIVGYIQGGVIQHRSIVVHITIIIVESIIHEIIIIVMG